MESKTIKTLAQYIANLHQKQTWLENPEEYINDKTDTNGIEQDHVETFWPPETETSSRANS